MTLPHEHSFFSSFLLLGLFKLVLSVRPFFFSCLLVVFPTSVLLSLGIPIRVMLISCLLPVCTTAPLSPTGWFPLSHPFFFFRVLLTTLNWPWFNFKNQRNSFQSSITMNCCFLLTKHGKDQQNKRYPLSKGLHPFFFFQYPIQTPP